MFTLRSWVAVCAILALLLVPAAFFVPSTAFAQDGVTDDIPNRIVPECGYGDHDECGFCDLGELAQNIINFLVVFAVVTAALLFAWAGVLLLTAGGKPDNVSKARSIFTSVLIGLIVIISAWLIVDIILKTLLDGDFGPWNEVCDQKLTT